MFKLIGISVFALTAFGQHALAEESLSSCDVTSSMKRVGKGAQFTQTETCPDATAVTQFTCVSGSKQVDAILPVGFESPVGSKTSITFETGKQKFAETLDVTEKGAARIVLKTTGHLWMALAKPGTIVSASSATATTNVATSELSAKSLTKFKKACSL